MSEWIFHGGQTTEDAGVTSGVIARTYRPRKLLFYLGLTTIGEMDSIYRLDQRMGALVVSVTINSGDWCYEIVLRNVLRNGYVGVLRNGSFPRVSGV